MGCPHRIIAAQHNGGTRQHMTYCVGIETDQGLVFAADTRTSASFDDVRVYRKMHVFEYPGDRVFVIMSAGNLATTQLTISRLMAARSGPWRRGTAPRTRRRGRSRS
jgi:20S proteasome alpha/beta subunit